MVTLLDLLTATQPPPDRRVVVARKLGEAAAGGVAALGELAGRVGETLRAVLSQEGGSPGPRGELPSRERPPVR